MYTLLLTLIVIMAVVLILLVLVQNSKGGGLASSFSSSNQIMGVRKTTDFLEKATWGLVTGIIVLSIAASLIAKGGDIVPATSEIASELPAMQQTAPMAAPADLGGETAE